jgi:hypothetical protein
MGEKTIEERAREQFEEIARYHHGRGDLSSARQIPNNLKRYFSYCFKEDKLDPETEKLFVRRICDAYLGGMMQVEYEQKLLRVAQ